MYRRRHKHKLMFARAALIIAILIGGWWVWQDGWIGSDWQQPSIHTEKTSESVGSVLGAQVKRVSDLALQRLGRAGEWLAKGEPNPKSKIQNPKLNGGVLFRFGVISDSHEDTSYFPKILEAIRGAEADFVVHLGDLSNAGDLTKLQEAREILEGSGLSYVAVPGDHDYDWQGEHNLKNFAEVFQQDGGWGFEGRGSKMKDRFKKIEDGRWSEKEGFYFGLEYKGVTLIFLDSSDNQDGIAEKQFTWLAETLQNRERMQSTLPTFLLTQAPPYSPYFEEKQIPNGTDLLALLSGYKIDEILTGNTHSFARYPDAVSGIETTTVGAVGSYKNFLPMWTEVVVYQDGDFTVEPRPLVEVTP